MKNRLSDALLIFLLLALPLTGIMQACDSDGPIAPGSYNNNQPPGENHAPVAVLSVVGDEGGPTPFTVKLDGSGSTDPDGNPLKYVWLFSDDSQAEESVVQHEFKSSGRHFARLVVSDPDGLADESEPATLWGWGVANSPWPKFAHDERNSGVSQNEGPMIDKEHSSEGRAFPRYWRTGIVNAPVRAICVGYDGLVIYTQGSWLRARTPDGISLWDKAFDSEITAWPALAHDGTIVFATTGGWVYRVSALGDTIWNVDIGERLGAAIVLGSSVTIGHDSTIYVPGYLTQSGIPNTEKGRLMALAFDGTFRWSRITGHDMNSNPAITLEGNVLVNGQRGWVFSPDGDVVKILEFYYSSYGGGSKQLASFGAPTVNTDGWTVFNSTYLPLFTSSGDFYMTMTETGSPGSLGAAVWGPRAVSQPVAMSWEMQLNTRTTEGDLHRFIFSTEEFHNSNFDYSHLVAGAAEDSLGRLYVSAYGLHAISPVSYSSLYPYALKRYSLWTYPKASYQQSGPVIGEDGWLYTGIGSDILAIGD